MNYNRLKKNSSQLGCKLTHSCQDSCPKYIRPTSQSVIDFLRMQDVPQSSDAEKKSRKLIILINLKVLIKEITFLSFK